MWTTVDVWRLSKYHFSLKTRLQQLFTLEEPKSFSDEYQPTAQAFFHLSSIITRAPPFVCIFFLSLSSILTLGKSQREMNYFELTSHNNN